MEFLTALTTNPPFDFGVLLAISALIISGTVSLASLARALRPGRVMASLNGRSRNVSQRAVNGERHE